ncbi:hypothetical protein HQ489_02990 [Candidatus Woesearchaeota archaeon]|nr:hypothetical protein [Candidatus Woesearchaeota archaeon]
MENIALVLNKLLQSLTKCGGFRFTQAHGLESFVLMNREPVPYGIPGSNPGVGAFFSKNL